AGCVPARIAGARRDPSGATGPGRSARHSIEVVVDRLAVRDAARGRISESLATALRLASGLAVVEHGEGGGWLFSEKSACPDCGVSFPEIAPRTFSWSSPHGACPECSGLGTQEAFDPALVVPDESAPLERAIAPWSSRGAPRYYAQLLAALASHYDVSLATPWRALPPRARDGILFGAGARDVELAVSREGRHERFRRRWDGVLAELARRYEAGSELERTQLARYRSPVPCRACGGSRLRAESRSVRLCGHSIDMIARRSVDDTQSLLASLELSPVQRAIADRVLVEISERLRFLQEV